MIGNSIIGYSSTNLIDPYKGFRNCSFLALGTCCHIGIYQIIFISKVIDNCRVIDISLVASNYQVIDNFWVIDIIWILDNCWVIDISWVVDNCKVDYLSIDYFEDTTIDSQLAMMSTKQVCFGENKEDFRYLSLKYIGNIDRDLTWVPSYLTSISINNYWCRALGSFGRCCNCSVLGYIGSGSSRSLGFSCCTLLCSRVRKPEHFLIFQLQFSV